MIMSASASRTAEQPPGASPWMFDERFADRRGQPRRLPLELLTATCSSSVRWGSAARLLRRQCSGRSPAGSSTPAWSAGVMGTDDGNAAPTAQRAAQRAVRRIGEAPKFPAGGAPEVGVRARRHRRSGRRRRASLPAGRPRLRRHRFGAPARVVGAAGARPLHGRPLLRRTWPPTVARTPWQASAARPRHALGEGSGRWPPCR